MSLFSRVAYEATWAPRCSVVPESTTRTHKRAKGWGSPGDIAIWFIVAPLANVACLIVRESKVQHSREWLLFAIADEMQRTGADNDLHRATYAAFDLGNFP